MQQLRKVTRMARSDKRQQRKINIYKVPLKRITKFAS